MSRAKAKRLTADGAVRVNGRRARKGDRVNAGERVALESDPQPTDFPASPDPDAPLEVVYEDADLVIVNKPADMPCHPLRPDERGTLAGALVARYPEMAGIGHAAREPGIIHRLDNDTTGLVIAARTAEAFTALRGLLDAGAIDKRYRALCMGTVRAPQMIDAPLAHDPADRRAMVAVLDERDVDRLRARPASTEVLQSEPRLRPDGSSISLVEVRARSARRHQVRAHLAAFGHPLVGDVLYGGPEDGRHRLHASRVTFDHDGKAIDVEAPLPADFD